MAAAEEEARQKVLKELKEKNDMIINVKERKNESLVLKYYAAPKTAPNATEYDKEGALPLHWACDAQAKDKVVEVLLKAYPEGVREKNKDGELPLHLAVQKEVTADTAKALAARIESMGNMIGILVKGYPDACVIVQKGSVPLHIACTNKCPVAAVKNLIEPHPESCAIKQEGTGNLPIHLAALKGASDEVIELLVSVNKASVQVRPNRHRNLVALDWAARAQAVRASPRHTISRWPCHLLLEHHQHLRHIAPSSCPPLSPVALRCDTTPSVRTPSVRDWAVVEGKLSPACSLASAPHPRRGSPRAAARRCARSRTIAATCRCTTLPRHGRRVRRALL